jgi:hypothetical protein
MAEGDEAALTDADDGFHRVNSGRWFEHETFWFSFSAPEHDGLGGWAYNYVRPTIGVSGGAVVVWDKSSWFHMEIPYYRGYSAMRIPEEAEPGVIDFPTGVRLETRKSLHRYRLSFDDSPRLAFDLIFDAVMAPWVHAVGHPVEHLDQVGHVTGSLMYDERRIPVDCYAMRDRSWGRTRSEKWEVAGRTSDPQWQRHGGRPVGYTWAADAERAILFRGFDQANAGFVALDGHRALIERGTRVLERHEPEGYIAAIRLEGVDVLGREFNVECDSVSRVAMPFPGVSGVCWTSTLSCRLNGTPMWGEDQEMFPYYSWSSWRRSQRSRAGRSDVAS